MTDLGKLPLEELLKRGRLSGPCEPGSVMAEIRRRLEWLEACEAELNSMRLERDLLQRSVDQFVREEKEQKLLQERADYMLNAALKEAKRHKERLEKCEKLQPHLSKLASERHDRIVELQTLLAARPTHEAYAELAKRLEKAAALRDFAKESLEAERERCAKIVEAEYLPKDQKRLAAIQEMKHNILVQAIAAKIREEGK